MKPFFVLAFLFLFGCKTVPEVEAPWTLSKLFQAPKWEFVETAKKPGLKGILYESTRYKGKRVEVFAYYGTPEGVAPEGGWPAVVCVHGGGGTAFDEWVKLWNSHGYAAISMDLEGHYPIRENGETKGPRVSTEKPGPSRDGVFNDYKKPIEKQWYYHAVSQIILANSLIRSFPEVNPDKVGITGISWGGTLTSTTIGLDDRFKFAIPVYGCGFLSETDGIQGNAIAPGKQTSWVNENYDGSAYFDRVDIPTFWVNGTNDRHFPMPATQESSQAIKGPSVLRYGLEMKHGHGQGWKPEEIYAFADSIVKGGEPLVQFDAIERSSRKVSVRVANNREVADAELFYTMDRGVWLERKWHSQPANVTGDILSAEIPDRAVAVFFSATDERGLMTSSEYVLVE